MKPDLVEDFDALLEFQIPYANGRNFRAQKTLASTFLCAVIIFIFTHPLETFLNGQDIPNLLFDNLSKKFINSTSHL